MRPYAMTEVVLPMAWVMMDVEDINSEAKSEDIEEEENRHQKHFPYHQQEHLTK